MSPAGLHLPVMQEQGAVTSNSSRSGSHSKRKLLLQWVKAAKPYLAQIYLAKYCREYCTKYQKSFSKRPSIELKQKLFYRAKVRVK